MKKILICILLLVSFSTSFAQINPYNPFYIYYGRQPSAKSEAMGRGLVANVNNDFGAFYNPASTGLSEGLTAFASYSDKYYGDNNASYNYESVNYNFEKIGSFGLSRYYTGSGIGKIGKDNLNYNLYTLNFSREIFKDFFAGANLNLIFAHRPVHITGPYISAENSKTFSFDLGLLKRFEFKSPVLNRKEEIVLGASLVNVSNASVQVNNMDMDLPVIVRFGLGHSLKIFKNNFVKNSHAFNIFSHFEFEKELKDGVTNLIKAGTDITLYDIVSLRGGLYHRFEKSDIKATLTYGIGLNIPVDNFSNGKYPFKINIDYVNLTQPNSFSGYKSDNFNLISMKLSWLPE